jgi:hypothetical protein
MYKKQRREQHGHASGSGQAELRGTRSCFCTTKHLGEVGKGFILRDVALGASQRFGSRRSGGSRLCRRENLGKNGRETDKQ